MCCHYSSAEFFVRHLNGETDSLIYIIEELLGIIAPPMSYVGGTLLLNNC